MSNREITCRVSGLKLHGKEAEVWLRELLNSEFTEEEKSDSIIRKISITPSCLRPSESVALLKLRRLPKFLEKLGDGGFNDKQVEYDDEYINFDCHFKGLTQLYPTPENETIKADIVAITGLGGHAYGSWKQKDGNRMWLCDFLKEDMPNCRTMTYGYNSKLSSSRQGNILEYGNGLEAALWNVRSKDKDARQRPLIFIGHSFGGILAAHALVQAANRAAGDNANTEKGMLYRSIYGFMFFGTPHKGLNISNMREMLGEDNEGILLESIKEKSPVLDQQLESFISMLGPRRVVSFYEGRKTKEYTKKPGDEHNVQRWVKDGKETLISDSYSSNLGLPEEVRVPVDADHSMMVKFSHNSDETYVTVRDRLMEFEDDARDVVEARFAPKIDEDSEKALERIRNNLSTFDFIAQQRELIKNKHPSANRFLESVPFKTWYQGNLPDLWCYGEPNSGKTVRAAFLVQHLRNNMASQGFKEKVVLYICMQDQPAGDLTVQNLLGSLLRQLVDLHPRGAGSFISMNIRKLAEEKNPAIDQIREVLKAELSFWKNAYLIIDGLYQCPDDNLLLSFEDELRKLRERGPTTPSAKSWRINLSILRTTLIPHSLLKVCDRCQGDYLDVYYHCTMCLEESSELCESCMKTDDRCFKNKDHRKFERKVANTVDFNTSREDVEQFIKSELQKDLGQTTESGSPQDSQDTFKGKVTTLGSLIRQEPELEAEIRIWIVGVADRSWHFAQHYITELRNKFTIAQVRSELQKFPNSAKESYEKTLKEIADQGERGELGMKALSLVTLAKDKINYNELLHALASEPDSSESRPSGKFLLPCCKGLLIFDEVDESQAEESDEPVEISPQALAAYLEDTFPTRMPSAKLDFATLCISHLTHSAVSTRRRDIRELDERGKKNPFLHYASQHWGEHLQEALKESYPADKGIKSALNFLKRRHLVAAYIQNAWYKSDNPNGWDVYAGVDALHICAWFGLHPLIQKLCRITKSHIDVLEETYDQTPLMYACRKGHVETVRELLKCKADINKVSKKGRTPLMEAVLRNHKDVVKVLAEKKNLNVNIPNPKQLDRTALMQAASLHQVDIVRILLRKTDANLGKQDARGYTALHLAIMADNNNFEEEVAQDPQNGSSTRSSTIKLLLDKMSRSDIDTIDHDHGYSALVLAIRVGDPVNIDRLLRHKADASLSDKDGMTPLMHAIWSGNAAMVTKIIPKSRLECVDGVGRGPIHYAAINGSPEIIRSLRIKNMDLNAQDKYGCTPLHYAVISGNIDAVAVLVDLGADISIKDNAGRDLVTTACQYGQEEILDLLQAHDASSWKNQPLNLEELETSRPLWSLAYVQDQEEFSAKLSTVTLPEQFNAELEPGTANSPLHIAANQAQDYEILKIILKHNTDQPPVYNVNAQNNDGNTALHLAVQQSNRTAVNFLLIRHADVSIRNRWDESPFDLAYRLAYSNEDGLIASDKSNPDQEPIIIAIMLLENGADWRMSDVSVLNLLISAVKMGTKSKPYEAVKRLMAAEVDGGAEVAMLVEKLATGEMLDILRSSPAYDEIEDEDVSSDEEDDNSDVDMSADEIDQGDRESEGESEIENEIKSERKSKSKSKSKNKFRLTASLVEDSGSVRKSEVLTGKSRSSEGIMLAVLVLITGSVIAARFYTSGWNLKANIARQGFKSMGLHSDLSLQCPDPWTATWDLNVIWCLTGIYLENGATLYIPGSHRWQTKADIPEDAEKLLQPFMAKAGSIVVMNGCLWHTYGANITKDFDRALLFGAYNAPFLRGQVN